jgi:hypothetical protein
MTLRRLRSRGKLDQLDAELLDGEEENMPSLHSNLPNPEASASHTELKALLEDAILGLPQLIVLSSSCAMWKR